MDELKLKEINRCTDEMAGVLNRSKLTLEEGAACLAAIFGVLCCQTEENNLFITFFSTFYRNYHANYKPADGKIMGVPIDLGPFNPTLPKDS